MENDQPTKPRRGGARPGTGGARPGAGRPTLDVPNEKHLVSLPPWAAAMLRTLGDGRISRGIVIALEKLKQRD